MYGGLGTVELINFGSGNIWAEESAVGGGGGEYPSRNWNKQLYGMTACLSRVAALRYVSKISCSQCNNKTRLLAEFYM
jgi:hypothetical protein